MTLAPNFAARNLQNASELNSGKSIQRAKAVVRQRIFLDFKYVILWMMYRVVFAIVNIPGTQCK